MVDKRHFTAEKIGRKGGETRAAKYNKEELSQQAIKAAQTVEDKHSGFYSEIGSKGGMAKNNDSEEETEYDDEDEYPLEEEFNSEDE
jgi:general stress protein YciG